MLAFIMFGRLLGAQTLWIESLAQAQTTFVVGTNSETHRPRSCYAVARGRRSRRNPLLGACALIFASVGSMFPFDRLVRAVDEWSGENAKTPVLIQIGAGSYEPRHADFVRVLPQSDYTDHLRSCTLFVAHVGIGSILQALECRKQMLLLPRLHALREHVTDHQLHTAARFHGTPGLLFVHDEAAIKTAISRLLIEPLETGPCISRQASPELIDRVSDFLAGRSISFDEFACVQVPESWSRDIAPTSAPCSMYDLIDDGTDRNLSWLQGPYGADRSAAA